MKLTDFLQNLFLLSCLFGAALFIFSFITQTPFVGIIAIVIFAISIPFLLIKPQQYSIDELFENLFLTNLLNLNNFLESLNIKGTGIYLPPKANEPDNYVFVPYDKYDPLGKLSSIENNRKKSILFKEGILLRSTGSPIINSLEKKFDVNFSMLDLESLKETLSELFVNELGLVNDVYVEILENKVYCIFLGSIYLNLCKKIHIEMPELCTKLGCPLSGATASILANITDRYVSIENCEINYRERKIETVYRLLVKRYMV
ncbi:hypothetical protein [Candidatus Borrarchaeum sp.]|uniref:hypothetical protein n=1 Tax=Candidatus Borrarchaeum sp. TaxID=2846742 RepID=UPI00257B280D|nr:hypothetical protein [Candidatus Borrarchaeum sp.]